MDMSASLEKKQLVDELFDVSCPTFEQQPKGTAKARHAVSELGFRSRFRRGRPSYYDRGHANSVDTPLRE